MLYRIATIINLKIPESFTFFPKSSKSGVYSAFTAHLNLEWPHFKCSIQCVAATVQRGPALYLRNPYMNLRIIP